MDAASYTPASHGSSPLGDESLVPRKRSHEEAKFDITAMIDLVFMLNIFFLVTTVTAALSEMDLPVVRHCIPTGADEAVIFSLTTDDGQTARLFAGEAAQGEAIIDEDEQARVARAGAEEALRSDKRVVLIKAEKNVKLRHLRHVAAAAASVPGIELRLAVIEKD
jgi:biopolymer transport protein ExbD